MPASFPTSIKAFTTKVDGVDNVQAANVNDLQLEVAAIETKLLTRNDYSASSTITGFASFNRKSIIVFDFGKVALVSFDIYGVSNSNLFKFTLPYQSVAVPYGGWNFLSVVAMDNGGYLAAPAFLYMPNSSYEANVLKDAVGGLWTASGNKWANGQFFFEHA